MAGQGESRHADRLVQLWRGSTRQCAHQAPDEILESSESADCSPLVGCSGATASPDPAQSIDGEIQDTDIAPEDWLEATQALDFALGIESTT